MVEQWSSKSYARVRILLSLFIVLVKKKKFINSKQNTQTNNNFSNNQKKTFNKLNETGRSALKSRNPLKRAQLLLFSQKKKNTTFKLSFSILKTKKKFNKKKTKNLVQEKKTFFYKKQAKNKTPASFFWIRHNFISISKKKFSSSIFFFFFYNFKIISHKTNFFPFFFNFFKSPHLDRAFVRFDNFRLFFSTYYANNRFVITEFFTFFKNYSQSNEPSLITELSKSLVVPPRTNLNLVGKQTPRTLKFFQSFSVLNNNFRDFKHWAADTKKSSKSLITGLNHPPLRNKTQLDDLGKVSTHALFLINFVFSSTKNLNLFSFLKNKSLHGLSHLRQKNQRQRLKPLSRNVSRATLKHRFNGFFFIQYFFSYMFKKHFFLRKKKKEVVLDLFYLSFKDRPSDKKIRVTPRALNFNLTTARRQKLTFSKFSKLYFLNNLENENTTSRDTTTASLMFSFGFNVPRINLSTFYYTKNLSPSSSNVVFKKKKKNSMLTKFAEKMIQFNSNFFSKLFLKKQLTKILENEKKNKNKKRVIRVLKTKKNKLNKLNKLKKLQNLSKLKFLPLKQTAQSNKLIFFLRTKNIFLNKSYNMSFLKTNLFFFFISNTSNIENIFFFFLNPFFFKYFFFSFHSFLQYSHEFFVNKFFNFSVSAAPFSLESNSFYTNIFYEKNFILFIKKHGTKSFAFFKLPVVLFSWHYLTIIKFLEFATGKKIFLKFYSLISTDLTESELMRCTIWSYRLKSFKRAFGAKLFLMESLKIVYTVLKTKDIYFLSDWMLKFFYKISFWKYKMIFRYLYYILRYCFQAYFPEIRIKGLKFQLKGKVSVAGNARTRIVRTSVGSVSNSSYKNKVLTQLNLLRTFTGVIGFRTWLSF